MDEEYKTALNSIKKELEEELSQSQEVARLSDDLDSLRNKISDLTNSAFGINEEQRSEILKDLKTRFMDETAASILEGIEKKVAASYQQLSRDQEMETHFQELRSRLAQEIGALGRRGNLNLALGIATTAIGLFLLGYFVLIKFNEVPNEAWQFTAHFVPRLTLVIFIETFAYFFLSLYKSSLGEIKYFQNELINVEAQCIALRTAVTMCDVAGIKEIVTKIGATERNFILDKKQTTVELERARIDNKGLTEVMKHFSSLLPKKPQ